VNAEALGGPRLRLPIRIAVLLICACWAVALGCDPAAGIVSTLSLRPTPARPCIDSVLSSSRLLAESAPAAVDTYDQRHSINQFSVRFQGDTNHGWFSTVSTQAFADSLTNVTVTFRWRGMLDLYPDSVRRGLAQSSAALLTELRSRCANPASRDTISCRQFNGFMPRAPRCPAT
jgi:hypothetical protein